jgi:hypothetical protein
VIFAVILGVACGSLAIVQVLSNRSLLERFALRKRVSIGGAAAMLQNRKKMAEFTGICRLNSTRLGAESQ